VRLPLRHPGAPARRGEVRYIDGNPDHPLNKGVICAKGSAGIMKQVSPARLTQPLLRKAGSERGAGEFEPISWERAFEMLSERLGHIRATDPKKFALFTGRDQMQALTGLFARQFGTPNYAAHGGFCSVNMAAGMIYTVGGSFWEFGGPDLDRAKLFVMIGTAEDHHSNPMKMALGKFKRAGGRFISINPVRTGYSAIADEWIPIRPGTDGALFMALLHELMAPTSSTALPAALHQCAATGGAGRRRARGPVRLRPRRRPARRRPQPAQQAGLGPASGKALNAYPQGIEDGREPALEGHYTLADGTRVAPAFQLLRERVAELHARVGCADHRHPRRTASASWRASWARPRCTRPSNCPTPGPTPGASGTHHAGRPVAFHAMRGLAAHSNGFQTVRALAVLMSVLGTIDAPGGFRHKAPYPRHIVPNYRAFNDPAMIKPNTPLNAAPLGFPASPEELAVHPDGTPLRIDHAFSWEHPLSAHGMMHNVITNAVRGDPYRIDTLLIFMANMAWNSTMNTMEVREMLNAQGRRRRVHDPLPGGVRRLPERDGGLRRPGAARHHLPGTARRDEHAGPADLRVRRPGGFGARCRRGAALGRVQAVPGGADRTGVAPEVPRLHPRGRHAQVQGLPDFIVNFQPQPGVGFLMGWRGKDGTEHLRGEPNPKQWEMYAKNNCVFQYHMPPRAAVHAQLEPPYLDFAKDKGWRQRNDPVQLASIPTRCRASASPRRARPAAGSRRSALRERIATYFDPLPFWYAPLENACVDRPDKPSRWPRSRSGRWRCTTRGTRRTPGCARSTATTTCT
jgi:hypothetical protein